MFEWDEAKRRLTIEKHGIDFVDAAEILVGPHLLLEARSDLEQRQIAIGRLSGATIAVIFTMRGGNYRIITARRARTNERRYYEAAFAGRDPEDAQ